MMSDYAIRAGYISTNYAKLCELPPETKPIKRAFTEAEIKKMEKLYAETKDLAAGAALIMIYTGMRWGEISTIKPSNIHLASENCLPKGLGKRTTPCRRSWE